MRPILTTEHLAKLHPTGDRPYLFAFTASAAITSSILSLLTYKLWFTKEISLRLLP